MKRGVVLSRSRPLQLNTLTAPLIRVLAISPTRMANLMGGFVMVKEIPLTQGKVALVDDADYEWLSQWRWHYSPDGCTGYARRTKSRQERDKPTIPRMHRIILSAPSDMEVDHINGDGLDNRRCNLRLCTKTENRRNKRKQKGNYSSSHKGVRWSPERHKWKAQIQVDHKQHVLGCFNTELKAAEAYNEAALRFFGEFARLNAV